MRLSKSPCVCDMRLRFASSFNPSRTASSFCGRQFSFYFALYLKFPQPTRLAALNSGAIHGTVVLPPDTIVARRMGMNFLLDLGALNIEFQNASISAGRQVLENKPEIARRFVKSMVEGVHTYKTDKAFSFKLLRKYLKTDDPELIEEAYSFYADKLPKKPYPTLKGIQAILDQLAKTNPKAVSANPGQFVNVNFLRELDTSGYIDRLYANP